MKTRLLSVYIITICCAAFVGCNANAQNDTVSSSLSQTSLGNDSQASPNENKSSNPYVEKWTKEPSETRVNEAIQKGNKEEFRVSYHPSGQKWKFTGRNKISRSGFLPC